MIFYKKPHEIEQIRNAGKLVSEVFKLLSTRIQPGITTEELDCLVDEFLKGEKAQAAFFGYRGFPAHICVSVDDEVVHGIPSKRVLTDGNLVSIDIGVLLGKYYGDATKSFVVGTNDQAKKLIEVAEEALHKSIKECVIGGHIGDLSAVIQTTAETNGMSVVKPYGGHGIGKNLHEDPSVPNFGKTCTGVELREGLVIAIEPIMTLGKGDVYVAADKWTVLTKDKSLSAHVEHTVAITTNGPEILTV